MFPLAPSFARPTEDRPALSLRENRRPIHTRTDRRRKLLSADTDVGSKVAGLKSANSPEPWCFWELLRTGMSALRLKSWSFVGIVTAKKAKPDAGFWRLLMVLIQL